jgi:hypothetical protein
MQRRTTSQRLGMGGNAPLFLSARVSALGSAQLIEAPERT